MTKNKIKSVKIFYRSDNLEAKLWDKKISKWINIKYPSVEISDENPQALIVLGGDGTILEAVKAYSKLNPVILGFNLGTVGFLTSVRESKFFLASLDKFLNGRYWIEKKAMIAAEILRNKKRIFKTEAMNEISIQNPLGMVKIKVAIENHPFQYVHGTGVLVSTATGSTAFNLSSHGPIIMPDIECMILTEVLDHNIPTPSVVVNKNKKVSLEILNFRKRGLLSVLKTGEGVDVMLVSDGETIFPLNEKDEIIIRQSPHLVKFAEFEKNYFLKSLQEKFAFK